MTDAYTKAVLTVIALALTALAVRPIVAPQRVLADDPISVEISQRVGKLEHNAEVSFPLSLRRIRSDSRLGPLC